MQKESLGKLGCIQIRANVTNFDKKSEKSASHCAKGVIRKVRLYSNQSTLRILIKIEKSAIKMQKFYLVYTFSSEIFPQNALNCNARK